MFSSYILTNPYFYAGLVAIAVMFGLILLLTVKTRNTLTIRWFKVYLLGTISMGLIMDLGPLFANSRERYELRNALVAFGIPLLIIGLLNFTFHFIGKPHIVRKWWYITLVYGSCAIAMFAAWYFKEPISAEEYARVVQTPWGYYAPGTLLVGPLNALTLIGSVIFLPVILIFYESFKSKSQVFRRQARIVALGISFSLLIAIANTILVDILVFFPPIPIYGNVLMGITITYALLKYGSSSVDPGAIVNSIVRVMNSAAIALDNEKRIIFANAAAGRLLKLPEEKLYGEPIQKFITASKWEEFNKQVLQNDSDNEENNLHKTTVLDSENKLTAVNAYSSKYKEKDGRVFGTILVLANVQKLQNAIQEANYVSGVLAEEKASVEQKVAFRTKELHEEQAKLRASIQSLSAGFMIIDIHDMVIMRNNAANSILDMDPSKTYGVADLRQIISSSPEIIEQLDSAYKNHMPTEVKELQIGQKIVSIYTAPMFNEENGQKDYLGSVVLVDDITERKIADRSKDEFFSIASHELRTPLAAIEGNSSMMITFYQDKLPDEKIKHMLSDIHESTIRLIDIVNDFLDVSRLEQGKVTYDYEEVSLDEIIEHVIYEMKTLLREKKLTIGFDQITLGKLPKVWADKNRLKQIIYNLTGNAVKFTHEGGIKITANVSGEKVKVSVTDTGPGIAPDLRNLLFHKFQQASQSILTRDTTRGTGLGLYISKIMIEAMGGKLYLERSEVGQGSTFSFEIPVASEKSLSASPNLAKATIDTKTGLTLDNEQKNPAPKLTLEQNTEQIIDYVSSGSKMKMLIVEDDPYVLRMYESLFKIGNFDVQTATNGKMGVETAREIMPDIILMDIMMPVMNGLEALEKIKQDSQTKHIPVIMLSNFGEEETAMQARAKGAESYLIKSDFTPESLLLKVKKILDEGAEQATVPQAANNNS